MKDIQLQYEILLNCHNRFMKAGLTTPYLLQQEMTYFYSLLNPSPKQAEIPPNPRCSLRCDIPPAVDTTLIDVWKKQMEQRYQKELNAVAEAVMAGCLVGNRGDK